MAGLLAKAGVIAARLGFPGWPAPCSRGEALQAGEYRFTQPASVWEVFDRIARGDVFYYVLVVPEGQNLFDIGGRGRAIKLFPAADFLRAARDPSLDPRSGSCRAIARRLPVSQAAIGWIATRRRNACAT